MAEIPDFDRITKLPAVPRFTGAIVEPVDDAVEPEPLAVVALVVGVVPDTVELEVDDISELAAEVVPDAVAEPDVVGVVTEATGVVVEATLVGMVVVSIVAGVVAAVPDAVVEPDVVGVVTEVAPVGVRVVVALIPGIVGCDRETHITPNNSARTTAAQTGIRTVRLVFILCRCF
ncbi:MAG TPA: hypothetical protein VKF15_06360 [Nitrososphaerales archaeon]|nr:hypothetical protein [Nitrososphaerales archaeon]